MRIHVIRAVYPHMRAHGGSMVMIGTDASRVATVGEALIVAMMQFGRALAREFGREKIRVNVVSVRYVG